MELKLIYESMLTTLAVYTVISAITDDSFCQRKSISLTFSIILGH